MIPKKLFTKKQAAGWVWPTDHSLLISAQEKLSWCLVIPYSTPQLNERRMLLRAQSWELEDVVLAQSCSNSCTTLCNPMDCSMPGSSIFHSLPEFAQIHVGGSVVKNPPANAGNMGLISASGRTPGEGNGNPFQYCCLGKPMDRVNFWTKGPDNECFRL